MSADHVRRKRRGWTCSAPRRIESFEGPRRRVVLSSGAPERTLDDRAPHRGAYPAGRRALARGGARAGKTLIVKGICAGLGVSDEVLSPSFILAEEYAGVFPVLHFDLYRLGQRRRGRPYRALRRDRRPQRRDRRMGGPASCRDAGADVRIVMEIAGRPESHDSDRGQRELIFPARRGLRVNGTPLILALDTSHQRGSVAVSRRGRGPLRDSLRRERHTFGDAASVRRRMPRRGEGPAGRRRPDRGRPRARQLHRPADRARHGQGVRRGAPHSGRSRGKLRGARGGVSLRRASRFSAHRCPARRGVRRPVRDGAGRAARDRARVLGAAGNAGGASRDARNRRSGYHLRLGDAQAPGVLESLMPAGSFFAGGRWALPSASLCAQLALAMASVPLRRALGPRAALHTPSRRPSPGYGARVTPRGWRA